METQISPLRAITNPADYWNKNIPERRWELCYGSKDKIYLTDEEREKFVQAMKRGATVVEVSGNFITTKFLYLVAIRNPIQKRQVESVKDENGNVIEYKEI